MALIDGDDDDNLLPGTTAADEIRGFGGDDSLGGDAGDDSLYGGDGNDTLVGDAGTDGFYGGTGNDVLVVVGASTQGEAYDGGTGTDTVRIVQFSSFRGLTLGVGASVEVLDFQGTDIAGTLQADAIDVSGVLDAVNVGAFVLDDGNDAFLGSADADEAYGGDGTDTLAGNGGEDRLYGGDGNDRLAGDDGADYLDGGTGTDSYDGGAGNDILFVTGASTQGEAYFGGTGTDTAQIAAGSSFRGLVLDAAASVEVLDFLGGDLAGTAQADLLDLSGVLDTVNAGAVLLGDGDDGFVGSADADRAFGGDGTDTLSGGGGADTLDGGAGADVLRGGLGDDTYVVDATGDVADEAGGGGVDLVLSAVTLTLATGLDDLTLTGSAASGGTGNSLANRIAGNGASNFLNGGSGNDSLFGGGGNDTLIGGTGNDRLEGGAGDDSYEVDSLADVVAEAAGGGADLVRSTITWTLGTELENLTLLGTAAIGGTGNSLANRITGNGASNFLNGGSGNDSLYGGADNDTLIGGTGNDRLEGGTGNDSFEVDSTGDVAVEAAGGGSADLVRSTITYALAAEVENLTLLGTSSINGTGNGLDNQLYGNSGANSLFGSSGNDTLFGGAGNDTLSGSAGNDRMDGGSDDDLFLVDVAGDAVVERAGGGTDQVNAALSWTLAAEFENLLLTGTAATNGTGNSAANRITGNGSANSLYGNAGDDALSGEAGNDTLRGGVGADSLTGGAGDDAFFFANAAEAGDVITDFGGGAGNDDLFRVSAAGFGGGLAAGTTLSTSQFQSRADNVAQDSNDRFVFRTTDRTLWYDSNGNASGGLTLIADLDAGATVTAADILIVA